jgi:Tol biopolymer transport system component
MLTARGAFQGESVSDTLAAVLKTDPDWGALPRDTPASIRRLLRRCIERDRKRRLRDIGDALVEIDEAQTEPEQSPASSAVKPSRPWPWAVAGALAIALASAAVLLYQITRPVARPLMRVSVDLGPDAWLAQGALGEGFDLSPDGMLVVFTARGPDGRIRLATRRLDQTQVTPLAGTEGGGQPFFSPDGQWIGFTDFTNLKLKKISVEGGAAVTLSDGAGPGASWGDDGNITAVLKPAGGLSQVPSSGGAPKQLTELDPKKDERTHRFPQVLPGSQAVLFTAHNIRGNYDDATIELLSLRTGEHKAIHRGGFSPRYLPSGHLVYLHQNALFAGRFNLARLALMGTPVRVLDDIFSTNFLGGYFAFSQTGTLAYLGGRAAQSGPSLYWLESSGKMQLLHAPSGIFTAPRFSPDGKRLALSVSNGPGQDIYVLDLERDATSRVSFLPGLNSNPLWSPDGKYIVFRSMSPALPGTYWVRADGSGEAQRLTDGKLAETPTSFSPEGKRLAFYGDGIWTAPIEGDRDHPRPGKLEPFLRTSAYVVDPQFSPDGRWLAYVSNETGRLEVYVRPFPGPGGKWQISSGGGLFPIWSRNRPELFFKSPAGLIMVAGYTAKGDTFEIGRPRVWSEKSVLVNNLPTYDLEPEGKRFAVLLPPEYAGEQKPVTQVTLLLNFFDELRRRVPAEGK